MCLRIIYYNYIYYIILYIIYYILYYYIYYMYQQSLCSWLVQSSVEGINLCPVVITADV